MGYTSKIGICAVRLSRALANGTPDYSNATGALVVAPGTMSLAWTYNIQEGTETFKTDSCGTPIVSTKEDDIVKRIDWTWVLGKDDYRIGEIMGTHVLVEDAGEPVGSVVNLAAGCEVPETPPRFILEAWSKQIECSAAADSPYQRIVLPFNRAVPTGETRDSSSSEPTYSGFSLANTNFDDGPFGDLDFVQAEEDWGIGFFDDDSVPAAASPFDYVPLPAGAS